MASDLEIWASVERRLSDVEWSKRRAVAKGFAGFDGCSVDPVGALSRSALAAERRDGPKVIRRPFRPHSEPISNEVRAQWEYEFEERVSIKVYSGMPERCGSKDVNPDCCAYHATLTEVGCVEFYDELVKRGGDGIGDFKPMPAPVPVGFCSRCESVGHAEASCRFVEDELARKVVALRRERRAKKARARVREKGIALTDSGMRCCNPACGAVLYVELMAAPDAEACFDCDPQQFREGWHPLMVELFERSGHRLPPLSLSEYDGEPFFDDSDAPPSGHCSEDCCR